MNKKTRDKIIDYIKEKKQVSPKELSDYLEISDRAIRKQLKKLFEKEIIEKFGNPPKVFYSLKHDQIKEKETRIDETIENIINERYLLITPSGEEKEGLKGFIHFCTKHNLPIEKTAKEYFHTLQKYDAYVKDSLINGMYKMKSTFEKVYLDDLYYLDFYSIERFGKTKLGQLLLYAKQSQNKVYIKKLINFIRQKIEKIVKRSKIDGIGFIPPTVKREIQLIKELERNIILRAKNLSIVKIKTPIIVPQKTLNKLSDRIENAKTTFVVAENNIFKNILLVDDAVGSGATLNEIAKKIRDRKICTGKIIGLAIVGSFKGFDVISEV